MQQFYLDLARTKYLTLKKYYLFGATINETITSWFNSVPYHSLPMSLSLIHNAIVRATLGGDYSIHVINDPIPYTPESKKNAAKDKISPSTILAIFVVVVICVAMVYVSAFYIMFYIRVSYLIFKCLKSHVTIDFLKILRIGKRMQSKITSIRQWC